MIKNTLKFLILLFFAAFSFSCSKNEPKLSSENEILSFQINGVEGIIVGDKDKGILLTLPPGTDLSVLSPIIIVSPKATVFPQSGAVQNFSYNGYAKHYYVTAEDGSKQTYAVTVASRPLDALSTRAITGYVNINVAVVSGSGYTHPVTGPVYDDVQCIATAYPNTGFLFDHWRIFNPDATYSEKTNNPCSFMPYDDMWIWAYFKPDPNVTAYTVTPQSENSNKGTVSGGGTVDPGYSVNISATPATGYQFEGWYLNGTKVSGVANTTYKPSATCTLVAKFSPIYIPISGSNVLSVNSTATLSINNTTGATYSWDCSSNLSLSGSGNSVSVTANSNGAGWVCILINGEEVSRYVVFVGPPSDLSVFGPLAPVKAGGSHTFAAITGSPTTSSTFLWSISP
ncbi:MAG: InlB B-repeat-containing protein, partial [Prevotellaceae bacterium]|nr:InlB B-repeat-containing protein [Prevotellaceae bacterium]